MSSGEIIFIIFVALMLFGADKLPEIAQRVGRGIRQVKDATSQIKDEINKSAEEAQMKKYVKDIQEKIEKTKQEIDPLGRVKREK